MTPDKPLPRKKCPGCGTWISKELQFIGGVQFLVWPNTCPQCHRTLHSHDHCHAPNHRGLRDRDLYHNPNQCTLDAMKSNPVRGLADTDPPMGEP